MNRKTLTILFADLQGYTSRTARQSRDDNALLIKEMKSFVEKYTAQHSGRFVKAMGDGFLLTFESPTDGVSCAQDMQVQMERRNANVLDQDNLIQFRIGISTGEVNIDDDGDVYGDAVNIASRIQSSAEPDNVYISEATYLAMNRNEINAQEIGLKQFKNIAEDIRVYRVLKKGEVPAAAASKKKISPAIIFLLGILSLVAIAIAIVVHLLKVPDIEVLFQEERYEEVIQEAARILAMDPDNLRIHELAIKSFIRLDEFPEAKNHFANVLEHHPDGREICPVIAQYLGDQGRYQMASEWLREYCEKESDVPDEANPEPTSGNEPNLEEPETAEEPPHDEAHFKEEPISENLSPEFSEFKQFEQMAKEASIHLESHPGDIDALKQLGEAYFRMRMYDSAEDIVNEILALDKSQHFLAFEMGQLYEEHSMLERAIRMYDRYVQIAPDGAEKAEAFKKVAELRSMNTQQHRGNFRQPTQQNQYRNQQHRPMQRGRQTRPHSGTFRSN